MLAKKFLIYALVLFTFFAYSCSDSNTKNNSDGDLEQDKSEFDTEENTGRIVMKGGSEDGGNAKEIYFTLNFDTISSNITWTEVLMTIDNIALAEFPECQSKSLNLASDAGPLSVSVMDAINTRLTLLVPVDRDFCSLKFALPTQTISFQLKGVTSEDIDISINTSLDGEIIFQPSAGFFNWKTVESYYWVASLNLDSLISDSYLQKLQSSQDGAILIDSANNAFAIEHIENNIKKSFIIVEDENRNGARDNDSNLHEPIVGRGEYPDVTDGDVDGDFDEEITDGDNELDEMDSEESESDEATVFVDEDNDTIDDAIDNCPGVKNTDQLDTDEDNVGDVCDNCVYTFNTNQEDHDNNDLGDACDITPDANFCRMIECFSIFDYCDTFDIEMECIGSSGFTRGFCSSNCNVREDCPEPYSCINGRCSCDDWTPPPTCDKTPCSNPLDCLANDEVCNLLDGYCTKTCDNDAFCENNYGQSWKCKFVLPLASDACVCN